MSVILTRFLDPLTDYETLFLNHQNKFILSIFCYFFTENYLHKMKIGIYIEVV
jgi:hypothetical protein